MCAYPEQCKHQEIPSRAILPVCHLSVLQNVCAPAAGLGASPVAVVQGVTASVSGPGPGAAAAAADPSSRAKLPLPAAAACASSCTAMFSLLRLAACEVSANVRGCGEPLRIAARRSARNCPYSLRYHQGCHAYDDFNMFNARLILFDLTWMDGYIARVLSDSKALHTLATFKMPSQPSDHLQQRCSRSVM